MRRAVLILPFMLGCQDTDECQEDMTASGSFAVGESRFNFDETINQGLSFGTRHKVDIDEYEAGCLDTMTVDLSVGGRGCLLNLDIERRPSGWDLTSFAFQADSFCPNWSDQMEGVYRSTGTAQVRVYGASIQIEDADTEGTVCVDDVLYELYVSGDVTDGNRTAGYTLGVQLDGGYLSTGSTDADCTVRGSSQAGSFAE